MTWLDKAREILSDPRIQQVTTYQELSKFHPEIGNIAIEADRILADKFQWGDLFAFGALIPRLVDLSRSFNDLSYDARRAFVQDAAYMLYLLIDEGSEGTENRINIPVLFGDLEKKLERAVVHAIAGSVFSAIEKN
jgi:hypothetical protein